MTWLAADGERASGPGVAIDQQHRQGILGLDAVKKRECQIADRLVGRFRHRRNSGVPIEIGILDEAATQMHQPAGPGDIEPVQQRDGFGALGAAFPELDPRGPLNSSGRRRAVKIETAAGLPPLKPHGKERQADSQYQEADDEGDAARQRPCCRHPAARRGRFEIQGLVRVGHDRSFPGEPDGAGHEPPPAGFLRAVYIVVPRRRDRLPSAEFTMPNTFDPYREALVVEHHTVWPDAYEDWSTADRTRAEALLHASPQDAAELDYVRQHTGFARVITVTPADIERLSVA